MEQEKVSKTEIKVIVFKLDGQEYGFDIEQVKSIERLEIITRLPGHPSFIKGVTNMRGHVTPVIDLRSLLQIKANEHTTNTRMIITHIEGNDIGLIVDSATDVIDVSISSIQEFPEITENVEQKYIRGIAKLEDRLLILLDIEKLLSREELNLLSKV